jgi:hypothetical protein
VLADQAYLFPSLSLNRLKKTNVTIELLLELNLTKIEKNLIIVVRVLTHFSLECHKKLLILSDDK